MTNFLIRKHRLCRLACITLFCTSAGFAQTMLAAASASSAGESPAAALPDAPQPQPAPEQVASAPRQMTFAPPAPARKYAQVIEPGQAAHKFTPTQKLIFSFTEVGRPITILPSLFSAGYEQLFNSDPKYGHDAGAFGEKFGASMLRRATLRVFADGIFADAFHQDPRYYRIAQGSIVHRSLLSMRQAVIRRNDDGQNQFNYSGIAGRAVSAALTVTYYPEPSITANVVGKTFGYSILTDAGGNLLLEFLPNVIRKFPIMEKLRLE